MNFDRLRHVAERAELGGQREALLAVEIPEQPGSFLQFCEIARAAQRHRVQLPLRRRRERAQIFVGFGSRSGTRGTRRRDRRSCAPPATRVTDMTDNEMAKLHVRYMVGGHARGIDATSGCIASSFRSGRARC